MTESSALPRPLNPALSISLLAGLAFWAMHALAPSGLSLAAKVGAITALIGWAWPRTEGVGRVVPVALAAHAAGDGLLETARVSGADLFLPAVGAFLAGHLLNLTLLRRLSSGHWRFPRTAGLLVLLALGIGSVVLHGLWQSGAPTVLRVMVPVYMAVLLAMALVAQRVPMPRVALGAACYLVSDGLIGLERFAGLFDGLFDAGWLTWPSYYVGQWLLVTGLVAALQRKEA